MRSGRGRLRPLGVPCCFRGVAFPKCSFPDKMTQELNKLQETCANCVGLRQPCMDARMRALARRAYPSVVGDRPTDWPHLAGTRRDDPHAGPTRAGVSARASATGPVDARTTSSGSKRYSSGATTRARELRDQQLDHHAPHRLDRLPHRGQRRIDAVHQRAVVEPDDRHVVRHPQPRAAHRADRARGRAGRTRRSRR